jgi:integrase
MAYIEKLKSGRWRAQVRRKLLPAVNKTFDRKIDAEAWAAEVEISIRHGAYVVDRGTRLVEIFLTYMVSRKIEAEGKSRSDYIRIRRLLDTEVFMQLKASEFNHHHFREWLERRLTEVSKSSVRREYNIISAACRFGRFTMDAPIDLDIFKRVPRPPEHEPRKRNVAKHEIEGLWSIAPKPFGKTASSYVPAVFEFCCETAMRKGEALALKRCDIYEIEGYYIARLHTSKNGSGRDVPLSPRAVELYKMLPVKTVRRKRANETEAELAERMAQEPLFHISSATLDTLFRRMVGQLGYKDLHFHDSRHQATLQLSKKLSVMDLAKVTGHKSTSILLNVYYQPSAVDLARAL